MRMDAQQNSYHPDGSLWSARGGEGGVERRKRGELTRLVSVATDVEAFGSSGDWELLYGRSEEESGTAKSILSGEM